MTSRTHTGFTLIEVLIALAIVATTLGGAIVVVHGATRDHAHLEQRRAAAWVADNVINAYRLEPARFSVNARDGRHGGSETLLGQQFDYALVITPVKQTDGAFGDARDADLENVRVTVSSAGGAAPLAERSVVLARGERLR